MKQVIWDITAEMLFPVCLDKLKGCIPGMSQTDRLMGMTPFSRKVNNCTSGCLDNTVCMFLRVLPLSQVHFCYICHVAVSESLYFLLELILFMRLRLVR